MEFDRIKEFIDSYGKDGDQYMAGLRAVAEKEGVPIIRRDAERFLKILLGMVRPVRVLEIGTAVGYSALVVADTIREMDKNWHIDTCEIDLDSAKKAKHNIIGHGFKCGIYELDDERVVLSLDNSINILVADAVLSLDRLIKNECEYDFIFIDAAKAQYMKYLSAALDMSHPGTVIVTDNLFEDGKVLESHFLVEKRDRTIHDRMREYIEYITRTDELDTALLPVGDGMAVSICR